MERFWSKVRKTAYCWLWTASCRDTGYGQIRVNKRSVKAHRFSWELANGPIPLGLCVLHKCDTPACVRPDHLFIGTQQDNMKDMHNKGHNYCPKLNLQKAKHIRNKYHKGLKNFRALGRLYEVSPKTIAAIINNVIWKED